MVKSNTTEPNDSAITEEPQSPPLFPAKRWKEMNNAEKAFYRQMPEETIRDRWDTPQGQEVRAVIIAVNTCATSKADYSSIVGTIKTSWGKREHPKTDLRGLDLSGYSNLIDDTIWAFDLSDCALHYSDFSGCELTSSDFSRSDILYADFANAILSECNFSKTNLTLTSFCNSDLNLADLRGAWITDIDLVDSNLGFVKFNRRTTFHNMDPSKVSGASNPLFLSYTRRRIFLQHFKSQSFLNCVLYYIWFAISDCGYSFTRWFALSAIICSVFGKVYSLIPSDFSIINNRVPTAFSFYYYSVVTFTTLGFGDILPKTLRAEILVTLEVIVGYIMLGGLISIFASKFIIRE